jgi:histidinol-phosphate phosphatase family protein
MRPSCLLLDRDGVINELWTDPDLGLIDSPRHPHEVRLKEGAAVAIRRMNRAHIPVGVASNQPGVAKGKITLGHLERVTTEIVRLLAEEDAHLDAIEYCLHHPESVIETLRIECQCRKPAPGLIVRLIKRFGADPSTTFFVGDTHRDLEAAARAGVQGVWLGERRCDVCPAKFLESQVFHDLTEFVNSLGI